MTDELQIDDERLTLTCVDDDAVTAITFLRQDDDNVTVALTVSRDNMMQGLNVELDSTVVDALVKFLLGD